MQEPTLRGFPLSPQQRRLWSLERSGSGSFLRTSGRVRVTGPVDADRLSAAIEAVAARHEILRTTFRLLSGMTSPLQVINAAPRVSFERAETGASALAPLDAEPFDLAAGRLPRVRLTRLTPAEHLLEMTLPSLCCDEEGMALLTAEIAARYAGNAISDDPTQYADFAQWQNDQLEAEETVAQRELWRRLAPAVRGAARLPAAGPAETERSSRSERLAVELEPEIADRLRALAARTGTSLERVLLTGWQALLLRLTGAEDVVVAVAFPGRAYDELSDALGPYVRHLPLRLTAFEGSSFAEVLVQVHELAEDFAQLREGFSFDDLEADLEGERVPVHLPFAFDAAPALRSWQAGEVAFQLTDLVSDMDRFEARVSYREAGDRVRIELHHDPALLDREEAALLLERLLALLASAAARPESRLADLQLFGAAELRLLMEMNQTRQDYGPAACLHELFTEQARATPDAVALVAEGESLTYAELLERVRLLAAHLAGLGIGPESRVALLLDRGPEAVTAVLAVLAAGGAYVPLDPDHPAERLGFLLADSHPAALITTGPLVARVPEGAALVVCLDRDAAAIAAADLRSLEDARATPDGLAYVIYTSGSTGAPKGVMVSHRAIANRILWMRAALPVGAEDRVALKTLLGFDASIWEIFLPLISGARLVLARPDGHRDSSYLAGFVALQGITVLQLVPSMLGAFLEEPRVREGLPLRRLFCGGEALPAERVRRFQELLPAAELHNLYGPTESSIDATHWACQPGDASRTVPIGRPIGNVRVHVTDSELRPVPLGVGGELWIGGAGLARGYNGRPDLTADRFIPDPFSGELGARLYRTGDLARVLRQGVVEFLGRLDHQVKIRGYRIELGEIESVLLGHAAVREVVVAVREQGGDRRLVAYVVPRPGEESSAADLRAFLEERLPEYMVPGSFVWLEALPLMANGKVNRSALPEPLEAAGMLTEAVAPRTLVEDLLAGIWADLLGRERIGVLDEFFALGGHSLLATQMASRIRAALQVEVPLRTLLANPTVAAQAIEVEAILAGRRGLEAPPIVPVPRDRQMPLSFAQQRLWIVQQLDPASAAFNIPMAVRLQGRLDLAAVAWSFTEIHRRHEVLRTTFIEAGRHPVQRIAEAADPRVVLIDLQSVPEEGRSGVVDELVRDELVRPFDLERGPLQRIVLVRQSPDEHVAVLATHHSVSDAWSTGILIRELAALYRAHVEGRPSPLSDLPVQYADFAWWQRQWLQGEVLEAHLDFWRRQLEGAPPLLALPTDRPRPAVASTHGRVRSHLFAEGLGERLRATSRREGGTVFMLLLAGFYALLRHLTGEDDLVVGTDVANRNRIETEPLIGFFVNQLVLRGRVPAEGSFRDLLKQVRETTLEAYAHQDLPFDKVVEVLRPERSLAHAPIFQVKLNVQNVPSQILEVPGLTLAPLDFTSTTSQLDLVVNVVDDGASFYGSIHYNTDLFLAETIGDWWADYEKILSAVADRPETSLAELGEMLAEARQERQAERERQLEQASLDRLKRGRRSAVRIPAGVTPADGF
jgi:amino acid adenylation domain-containing protein